MAKIGLKYPVFKPELQETIVLGAAVTANISITAADAKQYGDDGITESDTGFQEGKLDLTTTELSTENQAILLGHKIDEATGEMTANGSDVSPYGKFAFYGVKRVNGKNKYRAIILMKTQFSEPSDENQTREGALAFGNATISSYIMVDNNGDWKKENTFDTEQEAITYINKTLGDVNSPSGFTQDTPESNQKGE